MSDFERRREKNKEARELVKIRKENIAKYFFDLSKLTFAALVLGLGGAFFNIGNRERLSYVDTIPLIIWYIFWSWLSCYRMVRIYWKFNT